MSYGQEKNTMDIDYKAIREQKTAQFLQFLEAKKKAEQNGEVVTKRIQ